MKGAEIARVSAQAYTIPTEAPEADGTFSWNSTTIVIAKVDAGACTGLGYTYSPAVASALINDILADAVCGKDAFDIPANFLAMQQSVRNIGRPGLGMAAISAVDAALWDLKGKLLELPLVMLLGSEREEVPVYGSGGFTSYSQERLTDQLRSWVEQDGCRWVKMKTGADPDADLERVRWAREAIGGAGLFVDANGAYSRKQALCFAHEFADLGVTWFEEPVSSDDLEGLRLLRDRCPAGMDIAAGEYASTPADFLGLLKAGAVDALQADATRCGGVTGFLRAAALCAAHQLDISAHTAPTLHRAVAAAVPRLRHVEWFHDHVRIEQILFDGAATVSNGAMRPDRSRPGMGLELKRPDAEKFAA